MGCMPIDDFERIKWEGARLCTWQSGLCTGFGVACRVCVGMVVRVQSFAAELADGQGLAV